MIVFVWQNQSIALILQRQRGFLLFLIVNQGGEGYERFGRISS